MITLLTGPNAYTIAEMLREQSRDFVGDIETFEAAELEPRQLPDLFVGTSLFGSNRHIIIRSAASNKALWSDLDQWIDKVPDETEIVLVEPNPDKRTKTYKQIQKHGVIKEHKELSEPELVSWLQTHARSLGTELTPDMSRYLVSYVGRDQWRLSSELQKALLTEKPLTKELIQDVVEPYPDATAFELLDAVFKRNESRADELLTLIAGREDPYQFFGLLSSQVLALYAIATAGSKRPADIASDMGLHPFVISKQVPVARELGQRRIAKLVDALAHCDVRIKTSGVDPWLQLRLTLFSFS